MKIIPVSQGKSAFVDDEDFERLNKYNWFFGNQKYAWRNTKRDVSIKRNFLPNGKSNKTRKAMQYDVLAKKEGYVLDHINLNGLDNRKSNLRYVTQAQNLLNRPISRSKNRTSKYKGVSFNKNLIPRPWEARIQLDKKQFRLGRFHTEEEAALAYNEASIKYHGEFGRLNIIPNA